MQHSSAARCDSQRIALVTLALSIGLGGVAMAQRRAPTEHELAEAQQRFQRATELFEENNPTGALAEFRRAYALAPNYKVLYNIGQICVLTHDVPCAYTAFTDYLAEGAGEVPAARREEVQRDLARLEGRVARLRISVDRPGAEVTVDDVRVGTTPLGRPVLVAAGRHQVRVTLDDHPPATRMVEVAGMETAQVDLSLGPPVRPDPAGTVGAATESPARRSTSGRAAPAPDLRSSAPTPASSSGALRISGVGLGVAGAAGLAGGVLATLKVRSIERDVQNARLGEFDADQLASRNRLGRRYQTLQWVGYGAGGAALVTGIVLYVVGGSDAADESSGRPHLTASVSPGGSAQLGLAGNF